MAESTYLRIEKIDRVCIVTLAGPGPITVIGTPMLRALDAVFNDLRRDPAVKAVILAGGGKAFAAGADIKEMMGMSSDAAIEFSQLGNNVFGAIACHPVPVIAAVNGAALGGGLELLLCADFAYASTLARFALPEVTLGLIPGFGGCRRLPAAIGMPAAKELAFTGRVIGAEEALRLGIVTKVTDPDALMPAALSAAREIVAASGHAVREVKELLGVSSTQPVDEASTLEIGKFGMVFAHSDAASGLGAFINKSIPTWRDNQ